MPKDHPVRWLNPSVDACPRSLARELDALKALMVCTSGPPERLFTGSLPMALFSMRSERPFCGQLGYHLMSRWFLDMNLTVRLFDHSAFSQYRARLSQFVAGADATLFGFPLQQRNVALCRCRRHPTTAVMRGREAPGSTPDLVPARQRSGADAEPRGHFLKRAFSILVGFCRPSSQGLGLRL